MSESQALTVQSRTVGDAARIMGEAEFDNVFRMAKALAASGMFKDVQQAEQAFGRILLGADLGLSPTQALMGIDVVRGNVQLRGTLLLSFVRKHPDYDYAITEHTDEAATVVIYRHGEVEGESRFTIKDAARAGLVKDGSPWKAHPGNMCIWRAASNAVKFFAPDLLGGIPVYTEADSFEEPKTIGAGEGSGEDPGWPLDMDPSLVFLIEGVMARADKLGHAGLGTGARGPIQMKLGHQQESVVTAWLEDAESVLDAIEDQQEPPEAEVVAGPEPEPQDGGEQAALDVDGES